MLQLKRSANQAELMSTYRQSLKEVAINKANKDRYQFQWAIDRGARILNCSFTTDYQRLENVVRGIYFEIFKIPMPLSLAHQFVHFLVDSYNKKMYEFFDQHPMVIFIAAAGNGAQGHNISQYPSLVGNLSYHNSLVVTALNKYNTIREAQVASFAHFSSKEVDFAAAGTDIVGAVPGEEYMAFSGTSFAAPYVSGVVNQILEVNPKLSGMEVKLILASTAQTNRILRSQVAYGIINLDKALSLAKLSLKYRLLDIISN
jgi:hypothetical protein